jgi:hypothetical protein
MKQTTALQEKSKKSVEELYKSIFSIRDNLQTVVQDATELANQSEAFGGEIARVVTDQVNKYFVPAISKFIDDAATPGAMAPLVTFLDSVPLAMTRQEPQPQATTPAPVSTESASLTEPPTSESPIEGSYAEQTTVNESVQREGSRRYAQEFNTIMTQLSARSDSVELDDELMEYAEHVINTVGTVTDEIADPGTWSPNVLRRVVAKGRKLLKGSHADPFGESGSKPSQQDKLLKEAAAAKDGFAVYRKSDAETTLGTVGNLQDEVIATFATKEQADDRAAALMSTLLPFEKSTLGVEYIAAPLTVAKPEKAEGAPKGMKEATIQEATNPDQEIQLALAYLRSKDPSYHAMVVNKLSSLAGTQLSDPITVGARPVSTSAGSYFRKAFRNADADFVENLIDSLEYSDYARSEEFFDAVRTLQGLHESIEPAASMDYTPIDDALNFIKRSDGQTFEMMLQDSMMDSDGEPSLESIRTSLIDSDSDYIGDVAMLLDQLGYEYTDEFSGAMRAAMTAPNTNQFHEASSRSGVIQAKDWDRMMDLILAGKDSGKVAGVIKDKDKAIARYVAGVKLDPKSRFRDLYDKAIELGATAAEIEALVASTSIPTEVEERYTLLKSKRLSSRFVSPISREVLKMGFDIEYLPYNGNALTSAGKDAMRRNGRKWTIGYKTEITAADKKIGFTFDAITDEGGGTTFYAIYSFGTARVDSVEMGQRELLAWLRNQLPKAN